MAKGKGKQASEFIHVENVSDEMRPEVERKLGQWRKMIADLAHPDVELEAEELAPVLATWAHLRRAGVRFDPLLNVLLGKLRDQMFGTEADPDFDLSDAGIESEESIEEGGESLGGLNFDLRAVIGSEIDSDYDASDELIDLEDSDEDGSDERLGFADDGLDEDKMTEEHGTTN